MDELIIPSNKIFKILNDQRKSGQFCDLTIKLKNDYQVWAHFCIVAPQSNFVGNKYFLQEDMQFSIHNPLKIEIVDFDCEECLCDIVDFMYCEDVTVFAEHEEHMKHLCKMFSVKELLNILSGDIDVGEVNDKCDSSSKEMILNVKSMKTLKRGYQYKIKTGPASSKMNSCPGCKYKCYRITEMIAHLNACDSTNSKCPLCDKQYETVIEFKDHLIRHDNLKPFFCYECDLRFTTKTTLNMHTPKHFTETPHMCPYCGRLFKWKHGLNQHLAVHSNEKKLLCDECGYSTKHLKLLRTHQLSHAGIMLRCPTPGCSYTSRRKENLKTHIETHRKETPFVCEICGRSFSQNKNLKRHALLHISRDLHKCPHCSFRNSRTDKLKEHIHRLHTEKPVQLELSEHVESSLELKEPDMTIVNLNIIPQEAELAIKKKVHRKQTVKEKPSKILHFPRKPIPIVPKPSEDLMLIDLLANNF